MLLNQFLCIFLQRDDHSLLAQFFFADDALNMVAAELDSFDGRKDPDRCSTLVNQLRHAQVGFYFCIFIQGKDKD